MEFYRYAEVYYDSIGVRVNEMKFILLKETPKGYWIKHTWDHKDEFKKWVSKEARSRYAYPTKQEALQNLKARKNRQIKICEGTIQRARQALFQAEHMEV